MTLQGHVRNGAIVLDEPQQLPEGAAVRVEVVQSAPIAASEPPTLLERLGPVVGSVHDLPEDASINLKHYLYGRPKR